MGSPAKCVFSGSTSLMDQYVLSGNNSRWVPNEVILWAHSTVS